jgi:hypothetical protein
MLLLNCQFESRGFDDVIVWVQLRVGSKCISRKADRGNAAKPNDPWFRPHESVS